MSNLAGGQLHCSPIEVKCSKSLAEIALALGTKLYSGTVPSVGWGSLADDATALRSPVPILDRPTPATPSLLPVSEHLPSRMKARFYWDAADLPATRYRGDGADKRLTHKLNAVDVILGEGPTPGLYYGIVTTRDDGDLKQYVMPGIRSTFQEIEATAQVRFDVLDAALSSDFFLWLLHRYDSDPKLSSSLNLEMVRSIYSKDVLARSASLNSGAQMDRADLAALVLCGPNEFGPAQLGVYSEDLELCLEVSLHPDGSFQIIVGSSEYDERPSKGLKPEKLADDATFSILPALRSVYSTDLQWPAPGLDQFRDRARDVLKAVLALSEPVSVVTDAQGDD